MEVLTDCTCALAANQQIDYPHFVFSTMGKSFLIGETIKSLGELEAQMTKIQPVIMQRRSDHKVLYTNTACNQPHRDRSTTASIERRDQLKRSCLC
jgi:hypothetical protein